MSIKSYSNIETSRKFAITSSTDGDHDGDIVYFGDTAEMVIGTIYHYVPDAEAATGVVWALADADAVATGASQLLAIAGGANPEEVGDGGMLLKGFYRVASGNIEGTAVIGAPAYVSEVLGKFDFTAPSGTGDFVRIVGYCIDYHTDGNGDVLIYFDPDKTWVVVA